MLEKKYSHELLTIISASLLNYLAKGNSHLILCFLFDFTYTTKYATDGIL